MFLSGLRFARALPVNHDFFSNAARYNIWSQKVAWLWGWMLADGCVHHAGGTQWSIRLGVQSADRDMVEKMKLHLESEHKICDHTYTTRTSRSGSQLHVSSLCFNSAAMARDLALLGIVPRKTHTAQFHAGLLEPHNADALPHAVRGIFEGDGCLHCNVVGQWSLSISGSPGVLRPLKTALASHTGTSAAGYLVRRKACRTWVVGFCGNKSVPNLCNWLYGRAQPDCVLRRKELFARQAMDLLC
mmetsp:Transcript_50538/g.101676  ORF Transcript_50538/g.101676 Transcript_50538/m.101676 type:complete len:244 (-) Transcript_50538:135-866(-)